MTIKNQNSSDRDEGMCDNWVIFTIITISCFSLFVGRSFASAFSRGDGSGATWEQKRNIDRKWNNSKNENLWCNQIEACVNLISILVTRGYFSQWWLLFWLHRHRQCQFVVTHYKFLWAYFALFLFYFECNRWFDFTLFSKYCCECVRSFYGFLHRVMSSALCAIYHWFPYCLTQNIFIRK